MVYAANSVALAAFEALVHFPSNLLPVDYVSLKINIPDGLRTIHWQAEDLPREWAQTPAPEASREIGKRWIEDAESAVLIVPSAVIALESNILLNPAHPDAGRIRVEGPVPFRFDPRLVKTTRKRRLP